MNKKVVISMVIGVLTLVVLVVGATYAYFAVGTDYESYTTSISAEAEDISSVSLEAGTNLNLTLSRVDMMKQNADTVYYGTEDGTPTTSENIVTLATAKSMKEKTYSCSYTLNVSYSGNMKEAIPGEGQVILNVNGVDYDIYSTSFPQTISGKLSGVSLSNPKTITGSLRVVNSLETDQSAMAGTNMTITFTAAEFECSPGEKIGEYILANATNGLNSEIEGGMYRYQGPQIDSEGKTIDNYICFGTSDKDECINDEEHYMYRMIGITEDGRIKVIKKTSIGEYQWWTDYTTNVPWYSETGNKSLIYTALNGGEFLDNISYVPSGWSDLIADTSWKYGDFTNINQAASAIYATEEAFENTVISKIGLMYASDYYYSQQAGGKTCIDVSSGCTSGWIYLKQNDTNLPLDNSINGYYPSYEWTMYRYGYDSDYGAYLVHSVDPIGGLIYHYLPNIFSIRPVFFLKSTVHFIGGTGTLSDPFIISQ